MEYHPVTVIYGCMKQTLRMLLAAATLALAPPALADPIPLAEISAYFNGFETAQSRFSQKNGDGSVSAGTLYLHRPWRMRFEYDPPNDALVMAGGRQLAIFDPKSNQPPEQYPLKRTPLSLILGRKVDLNRADMVVAHRGDENLTTVVAQDPDNPDTGSIAFEFSGDPVALRAWVINDSGGGQTRVELEGLQYGMRLPSHLFNIVFETRDRLGE